MGFRRRGDDVWDSEWSLHLLQDQMAPPERGFMAGILLVPLSGVEVVPQVELKAILISQFLLWVG